MPHRTCIALLLLLSACATMDPSPGELEDPRPPSPRLANLQRAALYPWTERIPRARRTPSGGWIVQLTEAPLDLDTPAHLDALKQAYERFSVIGGRDSH